MIIFSTVATLLSLAILLVMLTWTLYNVVIFLFGTFKKSDRSNSQTSPHPKHLPVFSIIVAAKNEERCLSCFLDSISKMDYPRDKFELIIVDGASEDKTYAMCEEFSERRLIETKIIRQKKATGKPSALNLGLTVASGEIIGVFDADSIVNTDALRGAASCFQDSSIVAIQGRTVSKNSTESWFSKISSFEENAWFNTILRGREVTGLFVPLTGSGLFIRRRILEELGGWDQHSLAEDAELSARLLQNGYSIRYVDKICSWQVTPSTFRSLFSQRLRWYRGYMETAIRYTRLLRNPCWRSLDAEILFNGPFIMILCLTSYLLWFLSMIGIAPDVLSKSAGLATMLTVFSLITIGFSVALSSRPFRIRNLFWVPFIYVYWILQTVIAGWAFLEMVLRRPRLWTRTEKGNPNGLI